MKLRKLVTALATISLLFMRGFGSTAIASELSDESNIEEAAEVSEEVLNNDSLNEESDENDIPGEELFEEMDFDEQNIDDNIQEGETLDEESTDAESTDDEDLDISTSEDDLFNDESLDISDFDEKTNEDELPDENTIGKKLLDDSLEKTTDSLTDDELEKKISKLKDTKKAKKTSGSSKLTVEIQTWNHTYVNVGECFLETEDIGEYVSAYNFEVEFADTISFADVITGTYTSENLEEILLNYSEQSASLIDSLKELGTVPEHADLIVYFMDDSLENFELSLTDEKDKTEDEEDADDADLENVEDEENEDDDEGVVVVETEGVAEDMAGGTEDVAEGDIDVKSDEADNNSIDKVADNGEDIDTAKVDDVPDPDISDKNPSDNISETAPDIIKEEPQIEVPEESTISD